MFILPAHRWTREQHTRRTPPRHRNPRGWHRHKKREARSCRRRAVGRQKWRRGADKATKTVACPTEVAGRGAIALFLNLDHSVRIRFSEDGEYIFRTQASASDGTAHRSQSQEQVAPAAFHSRDASRIDGEGCQGCLGVVTICWYTVALLGLRSSPPQDNPPINTAILTLPQILLSLRIC